MHLLECSKRVSYSSYIVYFFILIHIVLWTLIPFFLRPSLTHDALEGIAWGTQWQWGYNKHPILAAYLVAAAAKFLVNVTWSTYFVAQLAVGATFLAVWKLTRCLFTEQHALLATLSLEGVFFYNLNSFNFTPDTLQSPLWAWLAYAFYRALTTQALRHWLLVGLLMALSVLAKYQVLILLIPMFLFLCTQEKARQSFKQPGFYYSLSLTCLLLLPHFLWLMHHQWITWAYAVNSRNEYTSLRSHWSTLNYSLKYGVESLGNALGVIFLFWPFYAPYVRARYTSSPAVLNSPVIPNGVRDLRNQEQGANLGDLSQARDDELDVQDGGLGRAVTFNQQFLLFLGLGPFLLSLSLCILTGGHFPPRWSTPYFFLSGALIVLGLNPYVSTRNLRQFLITLLIVSLLLISSRAIIFAFPSLLKHEERSDAYYPNSRMALFFTDLWHRQYPHQPLRYLAGAHYLVAAAATYSPDHPIPYFNFSSQESSWVNESDFRRKGGLVLIDRDGYYNWDHSGQIGRTISNKIGHRFPQLQWLGYYTFKREKGNAPPITVGVAVLPPAEGA